MKLKKNDNVIMLGGKDRGKTGKILDVDAEDGKIVVEGLNLIKRHLRARKQGQKGQVIAKERYVSAASVALVCRSCGKPTRIGYRLSPGPDGKQMKTRICKKCGAEV